MALSAGQSKEHFNSLLKQCVSLGASDMHLSSGQPVFYRVASGLEPVGDKLYKSDEIMAIFEAIMSPAHRDEYQETCTVDMGFSSADGERFRLNCYQELGQPALNVRHLDQNILSLSQLGLPKELKDLAYLRSGLVLVTGATGSGKSTTLALLLDEVNRNKKSHILTVEDPVEFVHKSKKSLVHHREVKVDVPSFAQAVRAALREDPDVIMVGEMRDLETMQASLIAAETGHLVFSTLHTGSAVGAVERFIGHFAGEEQKIARHRFSVVMKAVIAQQLVPTADGKGLVPAVEVLMGTHAVNNMIRNAKTEQIHSLMEAGAGQGMWTLDQALANLIKAGKITMDEGYSRCVNSEEFERLVRGSVARRF